MKKKQTKSNSSKIKLRKIGTNFVEFPIEKPISGAMGKMSGSNIWLQCMYKNNNKMTIKINVNAL